MWVRMVDLYVYSCSPQEVKLFFIEKEEKKEKIIPNQDYQ